MFYYIQVHLLDHYTQSIAEVDLHFQDYVREYTVVVYITTSELALSFVVVNKMESASPIVFLHQL
jgi:hypothetical protein